MLLLIDGSGRPNGNGAYLAEFIASKYPVTRITLRNLTFKDCNACGDCRKQNRVCTIEDDLQPCYQDFMEADVIILISPSYYWLPSGDVKKLIDRWYCMKKPQKQSRFKTGAKFVFFFTQGSCRKISYFTLFWLKTVMKNHNCRYKGMLITNCSFDDHKGIESSKKKIEILLDKFVKKLS